MGESFEIGRFTRDLFSLKDLWDCVMHETLGLQFAVCSWRQVPSTDGLSDVNEDNISQEVVLENGSGSEGEIDQPNRGTTFTLGEDGRIKLEVGQLFKNATHFRQILLEYSIQEGFRLKRIRNERKRITNGCKAEGCQWRVHGSPTYDGITYMLKTLRPKHDCLSVVKNKDITARWLRKRFETLIKDNPDMNIRVLASIVLRNIGVYVPDHTLYRAKRFALKIGDKDHKESYNKLYRYGGIIIERNPGSYVKLSTISYDPNLNVPIPLEYWTVHAFDTITKTDHNTNNVVEVFNGWLNKYRAQPLLTMMENVRRKFMKRMQDRYEAAMSWEGNIPPKINKLLQKTQQKGRYLDPLRCDQLEFEVVYGTRQFVVKLDDQTCQCEIWAVSGIPCKHAMACITRMRQNVEDYVHEYLKKPAYLKTYSNAIHAIPDESLWPEVEHGTVLPPLKMRRSSRPRLSRRRGVTEPARVKRSMGFRCSKCQEVGHNSRTYKVPVQGSRTEVLWFSSSQEGTSSQGHAGNAHLTSQNLMLNAPQQPQSSQGTQGGTQRAQNWTTID
ncbi:hypothetical protein EZV62_021043 [Acer yangbiense]|uniref:SWIM-type domain-containing protein n=1 Tax=Acer yangbiense TaxID=1000413 RepID=A0A5C7H4D7_9ROSI|nr:hypothetical protein EZV62_021043 [Acer yangbiense]